MENPTTKPRCGRRRHVRFAGLSQGPETLCEFIMSRGGLRRDQLNIGDFLAMDADRLLQARPGICKLIRKAPGQGMYVDHAREVAEEAGYLPEGSDINDLIDAVDSELRGKPVFASGDIDSLPLPPDAEAPETPAVQPAPGPPPQPPRAPPPVLSGGPGATGRGGILR